MNLSQRLRELRLKRKMTQLQLADMLNVARGTVVSWESGKFTPDAGNISRLAQIFDVTSAYLMGYSDMPAPTQDHEDTKGFSGRKPEEQREKLQEELDFNLAPAESDEQLARIRAIAMKIFDAQQLLTVATTMMADLDLITANDNQILDWQLEYLEKHARTARENLSSMSGVRPVFPPQIDD